MTDMKKLNQDLKGALTTLRASAYAFIDNLEAQGRLTMQRAEELRMQIDESGTKNGQTKPR